jgi:5-methylcytosine-specific restriction endonuclease McrA
MTQRTRAEQRAIERQRRGNGRVANATPVPAKPAEIRDQAQAIVANATARGRTGARQGADDPRYGSAKWQRLRTKVLRERPNCEGEGFYRSRYADHVVEVRDDTSDENFFNEAGLAALCARCHGVKSAAERARRAGRKYKPKPAYFGTDPATGLPLGPHWWNEES